MPLYFVVIFKLTKAELFRHKTHLFTCLVSDVKRKGSQAQFSRWLSKCPQNESEVVLRKNVNCIPTSLYSTRLGWAGWKACESLEMYVSEWADCPLSVLGMEWAMPPIRVCVFYQVLSTESSDLVHASAGDCRFLTLRVNGSYPLCWFFFFFFRIW